MFFRPYFHRLNPKMGKSIIRNYTVLFFSTCKNRKKYYSIATYFFFSGENSLAVATIISSAPMPQ